eukprot:6181384-Pleurochrysis_carterae.AAC.2
MVSVRVTSGEIRGGKQNRPSSALVSSERAPARHRSNHNFDNRQSSRRRRWRAAISALGLHLLRSALARALARPQSAESKLAPLPTETEAVPRANASAAAEHQKGHKDRTMRRTVLEAGQLEECTG